MHVSRAQWRLSIQHTASVVALLGLAGLLMSIFMTLAKFRSSFHCDEALLSACTVGSFLSCDRVLASPWSTVSWSGSDAYPITLFATAFYAVVIVLCVPLLARRTEGISSSFLLYAAWAGVLVCAPLAIYAYLIVGGVCLYCTCLYLVNLALLFAVMLLDRSGQAHQLKELWLRRAESISTLVMIALFFVALTLIQVLVYGRAIQAIGTEPRCITEVHNLPPPLLVKTAGSATTDAPVHEQLSVFVDLACEHCAEAFTSWSEIVEHSEGRQRLAVYPLAGDNECDVDLGFDTDASKLHHSCTASRAVECIAELAPERGLDLVEALFEQRRTFTGRGAAFSVEAVLGIVDDLGIEDADGIVRECIVDASATNPAHTRVIARTEEAVEDLKIRSAPATFVTFFRADGEPMHLGLRLKGVKHYRDLDGFLRRARAQVEEEIAARTSALGGNAS